MEMTKLKKYQYSLIQFTEMQIYWFQKQMHFHKANMIAIKCQVNQEVFSILLSLIDHKMKV